MSTRDKIRVEIDVPGQGWQAHEYQHCHLWEPPDICKIGGPSCRYGLSEIKIPSCCPMSLGVIKMEWKVIKK